MKDAYYFPHDSNAKDDPKCIQLIEEMGAEGYGIFWILIETLRSQSDYMAPLSILSGLARRYNTTPEKMRNVVTKFGLFTITNDDVFFFSESFMRRMSTIDSKRKKLSDAGKMGNKIRWRLGGDGLAIATQSQVKERKEKKRKEKESIPLKKTDDLEISFDENFEVKYIDEIPEEIRDKEIKKILATSLLTEDQKNIYVLKIGRQDYLYKSGNDFFRMKLSQVAKDAEYQRMHGWLDAEKKQKNEYKPTVVDGGYVL